MTPGELWAQFTRGRLLSPSPGFGEEWILHRRHLATSRLVGDARGMWLRDLSGAGESRGLAVCPGCGHCWAV
jgi:hypothetical protein